MNVELGKGPVEEYLAGVRAALADLPAPEVAEIVDDVRGHLADVRAAVGEDADPAALTTRLGTPEAYAAELRAAAGYAPAPPPVAADRGVGTARLAVVGLVASTVLVLLGGLVVGGGGGVAPVGLLVLLVVVGFVGLLALPALVGGGPRMPAVAALPSVRRVVQALPDAGAGGVSGFVAGLQPAWWVLRALVAAAVVTAVVGGGAVVWLVVGALFVPVSVLLGRVSQRDRRWVWAVVPLNALAAVLLPVVVALPGDSGAASSYPAPPAPYVPGLWQDGERQITDIRPVDAFGNPLTWVYLFDQDGRPVDTGDGCYGDTGYGEVSPAEPYPRGTPTYDETTGECTLVPAGPIVVAVPSAAPPTTALPPQPTGVTEAPPPTVPASPTG